MNKKILILVILLLIIPTTVHAGDWEFQFFGINTKDFEGRSFSKIFVGCISSLVVHEAGHLIIGDMVGMDTSMKWDNGPVAYGEWDYGDKPSDYEMGLFHGGGFIAQLIVGGTLTAIPYTRHSDFAVGFNGLTAVNSTLYGITGGRDSDTSDVEQLSDYGYNGPMIAVGSGIVAGVFTYINLDKEK